MMGITSAFSTLSVDDTSNTNPHDANRGPRKLPKNFRSLPNLAPTQNQIASPPFIRNNISDIVCDDESNEQPIDFSQKYSETNGDEKVLKTSSRTYNKVVKNYNSSFTMYAETDLDQPTDYSLRYAEDDSDLEECSKEPKNEAVAEFVQDTIKTYCTEDTPYETPFNFSTSTSMSDLRLDDKTKIAVVDNMNKSSIDNSDLPCPDKTVKSSFSSGLMSPEKPVNYCDEGTPGYFSRVASCGSLNLIPVNDPPKQEVKEIVNEKGDDEKQQRRIPKFPPETKAVKFEEVVNYAEETPLMFSRSSSLASLDSIEQHSIHDDRSSVVSDFSRLTSGLISPSELPDSPTQTVPPSPKPRKPPLVLSDKAQKSAIFEDSIKKFKLEDTPVHFSTATSLSSLTIDDHDEPDSKNVDTDRQDLNNDLSESSEDEDILAACINIGMQNNRYSQANKATSPPLNTSNLSPPSTTRLTPLNLPQNLQPKSPAIVVGRTSPEVLSSGENVLSKPDITGDSIRTYCTEDTPAVLSHAGSNSDLSSLSLPVTDIKHLNESVVSEGQEIEHVQNDVTVIHSNRSVSCDEGPSSSAAKYNSVDMLNNIGEGEVGESQVSPFVAIIEDSDESDSDDERLLEECVKFGMAKMSDVGSVKGSIHERNNVAARNDLEGMASSSGAKLKVDLNISLESNVSDGSPSSASSVLSFSDDSYESEQALLQECIRAGMPNNIKTTKQLNIPESNELTEQDQKLLQQCILEGMKKCTISPPLNTNKIEEEDSNELTAAEQDLLRQCILSGMPKNKNLNVRSRTRDSMELTEADRNLLQQCILAGMSKKTGVNNRESINNNNKQWIKRSKYVERRSQSAVEHNCCIHCPKNNPLRLIAKQYSQARTRRKSRGLDRGLMQIRDVNILYVTGQILALKKDYVDKSHEEWI